VDCYVLFLFPMYDRRKGGPILEIYMHVGY
jgi:hypothetical protein